MRCIHQRTEGLQIAVLQGLYRLQCPVVLIDRMTGTLQHHRIRDGMGILLKVRIGKLTQCLDVHHLLQRLYRLLGLSPAIIVGGAHQLMLLVRVGDDQLHAGQLHRCILIVQGCRIQEDGTVGLAHGAGELIHDAAIHAVVMILAVLTDERQIDVADIKAVEIPEHKARQHLEGGTGGKAGAVGNVAVNHEIQAAVHFHAPLLKGPHHALRVRCPGIVLQGTEIIQTAFHHAVSREVHGVKAQLPVASLPDAGIGADGQSTGENVSAVVVRMLTDQIHSARCKIGLRALNISENPLKARQELLPHILCHNASRPVPMDGNYCHPRCRTGPLDPNGGVVKFLTHCSYHTKKRIPFQSQNPLIFLEILRFCCEKQL